MTLRCPNCNSDNTQKLSIIYHGGTTGISTNSVGTGVTGKGQVGVGISSSSGVSQTLLAKKYAPPEIKGVGCSIFLVLVAIVIELCMFDVVKNHGEDWTVWTVVLVAFFFMISGIANIVKANKENKKQPELYAEWDKKYCCLRCETVFIPEHKTQRHEQGQLNSTSSLQNSSKNDTDLIFNSNLTPDGNTADIDSQRLLTARYKKYSTIIVVMIIGLLLWFIIWFLQLF